MENRPFVIGNWKMYKTSREATDYIESFLPLVEGEQVNIYLAVPYTSISAASKYADQTPVVVGAQNMNDAKEGAFTGEIAALMLREAGASFVLLGHSERRVLFHETDEMIRQKVLRALQDDIQPVLCIGENLQEHEAKRMEEVLKSQLSSCLRGVPKEDASRLIIAYEPVWAIGTGKIPKEGQIEKAHTHIRKLLEGLFGKAKALKIPILYGGSVKGENASKIASEKNVDGVLVGGASLKPEVFAEIVCHIARKSAPKKALGEKAGKKSSVKKSLKGKPASKKASGKKVGKKSAAKKAVKRKAASKKRRKR